MGDQKQLARGAVATVVFDPQHATHESITLAVQQILHQVGCPACGRLSVLRLELAGDPALVSKDLSQRGVVNINIAEQTHTVG